MDDYAYKNGLPTQTQI